MKLYEMKCTGGARQRDYRAGRGHGSGNDKTAGKGHEGQKTRSGGGIRLGLEDGQTPFARRLPKRGLADFNHKEYVIVNAISLNGSEDGMEVTPELSIECGLAKKELDSIKILGEDELEKKLSVKANKFFKSAIVTAEQAGEKAEVI